MKTTDLLTSKRTGIMFMERRNKSAENAQNKFWEWCRDNYQPYVFAYISKGKATVTFDMPTVSGGFDLVAKKKLLKALIPLGFVDRDPTEMGGEVQEIPINEAEIVAVIVLNVGRDFCARKDWEAYIAGQAKIVRL